MSLVYRQFDTTSSANNKLTFDARLLDFIRALEGNELLPHVDGSGIARIGLGYNLRVAHGLVDVIRALGFQESRTPPGGGLTLQQALQTIASRTYPDTLAGDAQLLADIDAQIVRYYPDPATRPRPTFASVNAAESEALFPLFYARYDNELRSAHGEATPGDRVPHSWERIALLSMASNGGRGTIEARLQDGITTGDRPGAWFEIRYNSNAGISRGRGVAERRYMEATVFVPFDPGADAATTTLDAAAATFALISRVFGSGTIRAKVFLEKQEFGNDAVALANRDYTAVFTLLADSSRAAVNALETELAFARDRLIGEYVDSGMNPLNAAVSGAAISARDVNVANSGGGAATTLRRNGYVLEGNLNPIGITLVAQNDLAACPDGISKVPWNMTHTVVPWTNGGQLARITIGNAQLAAHDPSRAGNDRIDGGAGEEWTLGEGGDDILIGGADNDILMGGTGRDSLLGGTGDDHLHGDYIINGGIGLESRAAAFRGYQVTSGAKQDVAVGLCAARTNEVPFKSQVEAPTAAQRVAIGKARLVGAALAAMALAACATPPREASQRGDTNVERSEFTVLRSDARAKDACARLVDVLNSAPELLSCPDGDSCALRAQQIFEARSDLEPKWKSLDIDRNWNLVRMVPEAVVGGSPHTTMEYLSTLWKEEYEPSLSRARSESALRVSEAFFDANFDGKVDHFVRVAATDCPRKPTLLSCFSTQMVVDERGSMIRTVFDESTGNYVPVVLGEQLLWLYWAENGMWGDEDVATAANGYRIVLSARTQFGRGAIRYFPGLSNVCLIGRK